MSAIADRWGPAEVRLWGGSALGALLLHLAPAALLVPAGSRSVLEVELAAMPVREVTRGI